MNSHPERILQFGEGNFLRGFIEWMVQQMNERIGFDASVVVVKPRPGNSLERLQAQDCKYSVNLLGLAGGKPLNELHAIDCISRAINPYSDFEAYLSLAGNADLRFVVSNTTEAGITFDPSCQLADTPPASFPAKLTQLLYHRYLAFQGDNSKGLIMLPCELITANGRHLCECVMRYIDLWADDMDGKAAEFRLWVQQSCHFCNTLVDRIVPGFPVKDVEGIQQRIGWADNLIVQAEPYHLWVIETASNLSLEQLQQEFPANKAGLNVIYTTDESPYHQRKLTLLNGPHTVLAPVAFLAGLDIVRDACQHPLVGTFIQRVIYDELMPTLNMPHDELLRYADDVLQRFLNPYIDHQLTSIMLNSFAKFRTRDLPALKLCASRGTLPHGIVTGLAAICTYYRGGTRADGTPIHPSDDPQIISFITDLWQTGDPATVARAVLAADTIWGEDLTAITGLTEMLTNDLQVIATQGITALLS